MSNLKTVAYAMSTGDLTKLSAELKTAGYGVKRDNSAGTMVAVADNDEVVVRAMQTGRGRGWIVRADPRVITVAG